MEAELKKIIIVDDSEIYRAGLRELINRHDLLKDVSRKEVISAILEATEGKFFGCHKSEMVLTFGDSHRPPNLNY